MARAGNGAGRANAGARGDLLGPIACTVRWPADAAFSVPNQSLDMADKLFKQLSKGRRRPFFRGRHWPISGQRLTSRVAHGAGAMQAGQGALLAALSALAEE